MLKCFQTLIRQVPMKSISFAVQERGPIAKTGEFFTALELGHALNEEFGWKIGFTGRQDDWYRQSNVDILVTLLDDYDVGRLVERSPPMLKIAWARNWFEKWSQNPSFHLYDIYLSSSIDGMLHFEEQTQRRCYFFALATNPARFQKGVFQEKYASDYCFTGSYWKSERKIAKWLKPQKIDYSFAVFGHGWQWPRSLWKWSRGFVPYSQIPDVYASTKLVIDDANETTAPWGSVNSRVFDALAAGKLVLTNGELGVQTLFKGKVPIYRSSSELHDLICHYLSNDDERESLALELQTIVLSEHTYRNRAIEFQSILNNSNKNSINSDRQGIWRS